jgi:hypothetical protein
MRRYGISEMTWNNPQDPTEGIVTPTQGVPAYLAKDAPVPAEGDWAPNWQAGIDAMQPIVPAVKPTAPWVMPVAIGALVLVGGYMVWRSS